MVQLYKRKGGEVLVNTTTTGNQNVASIASLADGGYVVTWTDASATGGDVSATAIRGQRFDANGAKAGAEFLVNSTTSGVQSNPQVATLASGRFVVSWTDNSATGGDTSASAIRAQLFNADGTPSGGELLVNSATTGAQTASAITALADGGFVVGWQDASGQGGDASGTSIKFQLFDASGARVGLEMLANSDTLGGQLSPTVASLGAAGFVIAWTGAFNSSIGQAICYQLYDALGAPIGGERHANSLTMNRQNTAHVTTLADGGFVITWQQTEAASGPGLSLNDIHGQRFDASGVKIGSEFVVNSTTTGNQANADVHGLPGGGFIVTWQGPGAGANATDIFGQTYDAAGAPAGAEFVLSEIVTANQTLARVDVLANGDIVVTWSDVSGIGGDASGAAVKVEILTLSNDAPTDISLSNDVVSETSVDNVPVAALSSTGALNSSFTYTILSDTSGGAFRIEDGKLVIADNELLDFETQPTVDLTIRTTDLNGHSYEETLTLNIADAAHEARYAAGEEAQLTHDTGGFLFTESRTVALEGGNYLAIWTNFGFAPPTDGPRGQLLAADGTPIGSDFAIVSSSTTTDFTAAALPGGGFMSVYRGNSVSAPGGGTYSPINAQLFDAAGTPVGGEITVNTTTGGILSEPNATTLADGHVVVVWRHDGDQLGDPIEAVAQIFDGSGNKLGGEILIAPSDGYEPRVIALAGGGFLAIWGADEGFNAQLFDDDGVRVGSLFTIQSDLPNSEDGTIAALDTGGFVVAIGGEDGTSHQIEAHLFDANGNQVGDILVLAPQPVADVAVSTPSVAGLPGGGFVVSWSTAAAAGEFGVISAQIFDALGRPTGEVIHPESDAAKSGESPFVTTTADGDIALSWTHFFRDSTGVPSSDIETRVFTFKSADEPPSGTANDDTLSTDEATALTGNLTDNDVDSGSVAAVNGVAGNVGHQFTLDSGALLTVNADGTFTYNPNHAFDATPGAGSGASNTNVPDGFTYTLTGGSTATVSVTVSGIDSDDTLLGTAGADLLNGGTGTDTMSGGTGNDFYYVDQAGDVVVENVGEGDDRVFASVSYALAAGAEVETLTTTANDGTAAIDLTGSDTANFIYGNDGANTLRGGGGNDILASRAGNDVLDGGTGVDSMYGGTGNDFYYVDQAGDAVTENAAEGDDRVFASASYALAAGAEVETLTTTANDGTGAIDLTGSDTANFIYGNDGANALRGAGGNDILASRAGNDTLDGGTGADTMIGATGNDFYYVDQAGDVVVENTGEGDDRVFASASYALAASAEVETLTTTANDGTAAIDLTGSDTANFIYGNDGANTLRGAGGNDILASQAGNDVLDGGAGADTMIGATGNDFYYVDNAGDVVVENVGEGDDRVFASVSYALAASAEVETLTTTDNAGTAAIDLTGSSTANFIYGNDGANTLRGAGGNDILASRAGNDVLDGGTGADTMIGQTGNDWYFVDNAGDIVVEDVGEGDDRVFAAASYALAAGADVETLSTTANDGTAAIDLTGSDTANFIYGNDGANVLSGGGGNDILASRAGNDRLDGGTGADTMIGGTGSDFYLVDQSGDLVVENAGEGDDRVLASVSYALAADADVETLATTNNAGTGAIDLTGSDSANFIAGNDGANTLRGAGGDDFLASRVGNDWLDGGIGNDTLQGGAGADTLAFTTALGASNIDTILDFVSGTDKIALDDAVFTGLGLGALPGSAFVAGTSAQDADDRIIYDQASGKLWFDADGNGAGAAVQFAVLDTHPVIGANDFVVV